MAVLYDSTIYTEPDGTRWYRLYHLNNPSSNGAFSQSDTFETGVYKDENRWFQLNLAKEWDSKEYIIKQKLTSSSTEEVGRFTQTVNCMDATYAQVANGTATWNTSTGYVNPGNDSTYNGGLFKLNNGTYICKADNMQADWWGAIGVWNTHGGGWPACKLTSNSPILTTGYIDVYVPAQGTLMVSGFPGGTINTDSNTYTLTVSSETAWTATVPQDSFATLDVLSGSAGDTTVTMTVASNRGTAREVTITFTNTEDEIPYTLSQKSWFKYWRPLDYIVTDGTQMIETNYVPNIDTDITFKMRQATQAVNPNQRHLCFMGVAGANTTGTNSRQLFINHYAEPTTNKVEANFGTSTNFHNGEISGWSSDTTTDHIFRINKTALYHDGTLLCEFNATAYTNPNKLAFPNRVENYYEHYGAERFYYATVTENNVVTADFIAAEDIEGVPCIYNKVTGTFHYPEYAPNYQPADHPLSKGPAYQFSTDKSSFKIGGVGETQTFAMTAENDWTVYSKPAWITVSPSTAEGSVDPVTVSITAERNDGNNFRFGTITFVDENGYAFDIAVRQGTHGEIVNIGKWIHGSTIVRKAYHGSNQIRQSMYGADMLFKRFAFSPTLRVWPEYMEFKWDGEPQTFTVVSNSAFTATCPADWVTLSTNGNIVTVTPSNNISETDPRSTTITVTANNGDMTVSKTVSVLQKKHQLFYTQIESGGNCWWDTGIVLSTVGKITAANVRFNLDGGSSGHHSFIGCTGNTFRFSSKETNKWFQRMTNGTEVAGGNGNGDNRLTADLVTITRTGIDIDGTAYTWSDRAFGGTETIWIFNSYNTSGGDCVTAGTRCGTITVYDTSDNIIANFEPFIDENDNVTWYNTLTETFLTNQGSGTPIGID